MSKNTLIDIVKNAVEIFCQLNNESVITIGIVKKPHETSNGVVIDNISKKMRISLEPVGTQIYLVVGEINVNIIHEAKQLTMSQLTSETVIDYMNNYLK